MESLAAMTVADYGESLDDATDSGVLNTTVEQVAQGMFPNHGKLIVIYHLSHGGIFSMWCVKLHAHMPYLFE